MLSPGADVSLPVVGHFLHIFAVTVWVLLDGHLVLLRSLGESFVHVPVGTQMIAPDGLLDLVLLCNTIFVLAIQIAAPVTAALLLTNVILGVLARTAPQMNLLMASFPLTISLGVLVIMASLPFLATFIARWSHGVPELIVQAQQALLGAFKE